MIKNILRVVFILMVSFSCGVGGSYSVPTAPTECSGNLNNVTFNELLDNPGKDENAFVEIQLKDNSINVSGWKIYICNKAPTQNNACGIYENPTKEGNYAYFDLLSNHELSFSGSGDADIILVDNNTELVDYLYIAGPATPSTNTGYQNNLNCNYDHSTSTKKTSSSLKGLTRLPSGYLGEGESYNDTQNGWREYEESGANAEATKGESNLDESDFVDTSSNYYQSNLKDITKIYEINTTGDIEIIGNSVLTGSGVVNNDVTMSLINSGVSSATLNLPDNSIIKKAYLYWQGYLENSSTDTIKDSAKTIKLKFESESYIDFPSNDFRWKSFYDRFDYQGRVDITNFLQNKGNGKYTIDEQSFITQTGNPKDGAYGGWAIIVVYENYENENLKYKNLVLFDMYDEIYTSNSKSVYPNGFFTPNQTGFEATLSIFASEGDLGNDTYPWAKNDSIKLNTNSLGENIFNSTILTINKSPSNIDIDKFDVSSYLQPSSTEANITFYTNGDRFFVGVIGFSTELFVPQLCYSENYSKNGTPLNEDSVVYLGDILDFSVTVKNNGKAESINTLIKKPFNNPFQYEKDSIYILNCTSCSSDYDTPNLNIDLNEITQDSSKTFTYKAKITAYPEGGLIDNNYDGSYEGGQYINVNNVAIPQCSDGTIYPKIAVSSLSIIANITSNEDDSTTDNIEVGKNKEFIYDINVTNIGEDNATNLTISIPLINGVTFIQTSYTNDNWDCSLVTDTIECELKDNGTQYSEKLRKDEYSNLNLTITAPNTIPSPNSFDTNVTASTTLESTGNNDSATTETKTIKVIEVAENANLVIEKINVNPSIINGLNQNIEFSIDMNNSGEDIAKDINVTISLANGFILNENEISAGWNCQQYYIPTKYDINCSYNSTVANGEKFKLDFNVTSPNDVSQMVNFVSDINLTSPASDDDIINNNRQVGINFDKNTTLTIDVKVPTASLDNDENFDINITITNSGAIASNIEVNLTIENLDEFNNIPSNYSDENWSCQKINNTNTLNCKDGNLSDGESIKLKLPITTPTDKTGTFEVNASAISDLNTTPSKITTKIEVSTPLTSADLNISNFRVTATHKDSINTVSSGSIISDFETELIFIVNIKNEGDEKAENAILTLNLTNGFDKSTLQIENKNLLNDFSENNCSIVNNNLECKLGDINGNVYINDLTFKFTTPSEFQDFNSQIIVSLTNDSNLNNNATNIIVIQTPYADNNFTEYTQTKEFLIEGNASLYTGSLNSGSIGDIEVGSNLLYARFMWQGFIEDANTKDLSSIKNITINNNTYNLIDTNCPDCNLSWQPIQKENYSYNLIYQGSIDVTNEIKLSNGINISNFSNLLDLSKSYYSLFVVYEDNTLNYMNAIEVYEGFKEINSSNSETFTFDYGGLSPYNDNSILYDFATDGNESNTIFSNNLISNYPASEYLGREENITRVGNSLTYYVNGSNNYYLGLVALNTRVKTPLCFYAYEKNKHKNQNDTIVVDIGDKFNMKVDVASDSVIPDSEFSNVNLYFTIPSTFEVQAIGTPQITLSNGIYSVNLNDDITKDIDFQYKLIVASNFEGSISSIQPDNTKANFKLGIYDFNDISIFECQNDEFIFEGLERVFDIYSNFDNPNNYTNSDGDIFRDDNNETIGDKNITTQIVNENFSQLYIAPTTKIILDNNRSYKISSLKIIDKSNSDDVHTVTNLPSTIINFSNGVYSINLPTINLSSAYRDLTFNISWVLVDESGEPIKKGNNILVQGTNEATDHFAVRPDKFNIALPNSVRAGENFTMTLSTTPANNNYNESSESPSSFKLNYKLNHAGNNGNFAFKPFEFEDGEKSSIEANISEVGSFDINITDGDGTQQLGVSGSCSSCIGIGNNCINIDGCPFACIDIVENNCSGLSLITSDSEDINITPYQYTITNLSFNPNDWIYMANVNDLYTEVNATIQAQNMQGVVTNNFTKSIFNGNIAPNININTIFKFDINNPSSELVNIDYITGLNGTDLGTNTDDDGNSIFETISISGNSKNDVYSNEMNVSVRFNINKISNTPMNPIQIGLREINTTNSEASSFVIIDGENIGYSGSQNDEENASFYYGRVWASDQYETTYGSQDVEVKAEIYCENCIDLFGNVDISKDFSSLSLQSNQNNDYTSWYQNIQDNFTPINSITYSDSSELPNIAEIDSTLTLPQNVINGIIIATINRKSDYGKAIFNISTPQYMWFQSFGTLTEPHFSVNFRDDSTNDAPGVNQNLNPSDITKRRIDW